MGSRPTVKKGSIQHVRLLCMLFMQSKRSIAVSNIKEAFITTEV